MAIINNSSATLVSGNTFILQQGQVITVNNPVDNTHSWFNVTMQTPTSSITGSVATRFIDFQQSEILDHDLRVDSENLPLFGNLKVEYIGPSNTILNNGEKLIVRSLWYINEQIECNKLENIIPNTDGIVGVQCHLLKRS